MKIIVSGASGLIGSTLVNQLNGLEHTVKKLVRRVPAPESNDVFWDPIVRKLDLASIDGADVFIHLSGESIASGRWNAARKRAIYDSRIVSTQFLAKSLCALKTLPRVWLCASATGFYGDRGDEVLTEESSGGSGFLAKVCADWEAATQPAKDAGIRVVNLRLGIVFSKQGGALAAMLMPIRLGIGGVVGDGKQYINWIALDDAVAAIVHALDTESLTGPVNIVSPNPVTNRELTKTLGKWVRRPTVFPLPAFAARIALGEMAKELLLASTRAVPSKLLESGFTFRYPDLNSAISSFDQG